MIGQSLAPANLSRDLAALLPGGLTLVSSCSAESGILADAVENGGEDIAPSTFSGIFVPGLNRRTYLANSRSKILSFFMTPELKAHSNQVDFLPLCYQDILAYYREHKPQAALFMCSPPDKNGQCSFGTETAFIAELWRDIPVRIAHINPLMPWTTGDAGIPFSELTAYVEAEQELFGMPAGKADATSTAIANHIAPYIPDGATLQTGLGKIPDAVLDALHHRKDLYLHTGLMGDAALRLVQSGAMASGQSATIGVAIGSADLYAGLGHEAFQFRPISVTHGLASLGAIDGLITINSALEVDLYGQVYAELTPKGFMSGPGGASDFARGARMGEGGLRIIAFPAGAANGTISRIIAPQEATGPVSLGRMDVDIIVTEYGVADLRGKSYEARAQALIAIAAPEHKDVLKQAWATLSARF
ncbi:MAG: acetyl-CoA hydrolase/transferase C-terminal domain-containing protein [Parasphingorhabdus sp.]|uniref:acetyl-CoA hydrolase/transferase family protein n=1 Tax=Parasphingorhabdus sp. TaxID=2709688 RepID=UPI00300198E0